MSGTPQDGGMDTNSDPRISVFPSAKPPLLPARQLLRAGRSTPAALSTLKGFLQPDKTLHRVLLFAADHSIDIPMHYPDVLRPSTIQSLRHAVQEMNVLAVLQRSTDLDGRHALSIQTNVGSRWAVIPTGHDVAPSPRLNGCTTHPVLPIQ